MDLQIKDQSFIVGGAGSGFGKAIAACLAKEGARVLAVSRTEGKLKDLKADHPINLDYLSGDISDDHLQDKIIKWVIQNDAKGVVINAGGPPAGGFGDISIDQWDDAYRNIVRWKVALTQKLIPIFSKKKYGRILFIESVSVKQPIPNLILSNALRPAIVGFAKTVSNEVAGSGITLNILAPGYHSTAAMERLFVKTSEAQQISIEEAVAQFEKQLPIEPMGKPEEMANLALWLLSPMSRYVTGQTITHAGGIVEGIFG